MAASKPTLFERAQQAEQRGNREVRELWERYAGHRRRLSAEILALAPPGGGGRVCLLGAGNANDLDLEALAARFTEVHLVDIDPSALARASGRQTAATRARLRLHAPVDLSGLYRPLASPHRLPPADDLVAAGAAEVLRQLPADFDVAVSCCVLSQMSWALEHLATAERAPLPLLEQSLLRVHLRVLLGLIAREGTALLAADLVSSATYPLDELPPGEDLGALARKLAADRVAFAVCNPELMRLVLRRDAALAERCQPLALGDPWLWDGPKAQSYLVCPIRLRRRD